MSLKKSINSILFFDRRAIKRWSVFLTTFLIGQGAVQILQAVTGFLIIRWLSVEEYAQYSLAFAFQSTAQGLVEFGFSGAIIALVGNKINNKSIIGNYIKAGRFYRDRSFIIIAVVISIVFPLFALDHNWSWPVTCLLLVGILSNLFFSGNISYYKPVLQMHKCFRGIYKISVFTLIIRFILVYIPYLFNALNAWIAVLSTSLMTIINGRSFKKKAQSYLEEPSQSDAEVRKEMFNYIKPIIPGILFATVQAQVTIFIISIFGDTENIAEVGALSRLGQLYTILNLSASVLIAPFIARQSTDGLLGKFIMITLLYSVFLLGIVFIGYFYPEIFFMVLGSKYDHLNAELVLLLVFSGLNVLNGVIWAMTSSRKWIYSWMPVVSISGTILVQVLAALSLNLSTTYNVLLFSLYTSAFVLFTRILVAFVGFKNLKNG